MSGAAPAADTVKRVSAGEIAAWAGPSVNPVLTIVARREPKDTALTYHVMDFNGGTHDRVTLTLARLADIRAVAIRSGMALPKREEVVIQTEDMPVDAPSVSWETRVGWQHVRLIPDLYYLASGGYEDFAPHQVPWAERTPSFVWRGSSTGLLQQTLDDLDRLPRYRLCRLAQTLGPCADVGLNEVVQSVDPHEADRIRERLAREGVLRPFLPMPEMTRHRHLLDIDGNSNSWNFMMKLRLGCCVLRVESPWRQWFSDRLVAWTHYVPVAPDLSDFVERAEWCLAHPARCADIAANGRRFALDMCFDEEMEQAARVTFAAA